MADIYVCRQHGLSEPCELCGANPTPTQPGTLLPCPLNHPVVNGVRFTEFSSEYKRHIWCYDCGLEFEGRVKESAESVAGRWNDRRAAVAGPPGHAGFIQKVAALSCARVDGDECFYFEKEVTAYCASCHAKYLVETIAATSSPAPAESAEPSLKELALEVAMFLDQIANRDFDDNTFQVAGHLAFALRANVENHPLVTTAKTHTSDDAVPALDCLVHGHIWKTEGNRTVCEHCGTGVEFGPAPAESGDNEFCSVDEAAAFIRNHDSTAPPERTRVEGEQLATQIVGTVFDNTAASHETLKQTMIERITDWLAAAPADDDTEKTT